jgi:hypothetical protein
MRFCKELANQTGKQSQKGTNFERGHTRAVLQKKHKIG